MGGYECFQLRDQKRRWFVIYASKIYKANFSQHAVQTKTARGVEQTVAACGVPVFHRPQDILLRESCQTKSKTRYRKQTLTIIYGISH
jgi:hypothetical protein